MVAVGVLIAVEVSVGVSVGTGVLLGVLVGVLVAVSAGVAAGAATVIPAKSELLFGSGSCVLLDTLAVVLIAVPAGVPESTLNINEKLAPSPDARLEAAQLIVPVPPMGGVEQVHPGGAVMPWKVVLDGTTKVSTGLIAASGPLLVTIIELVVF